MVRRSAGLGMLYSEELERLQKLLHFPEEVALQLTEVEYDLFYRVPPIAYVRHVTTDLRAQPSNITVQENSESQPGCISSLIKRFNEVILGWLTTFIFFYFCIK